MQNIKSIINNIIKWALANKKLLLIALSTIVAITAIIIIIAVCVGGDESESEAQNFQWGDGVTQGVPRMDEAKGEAVFSEDGKSAALYYNNITTEQVNAYIITLESQLGIRFQGNTYPRSAIYGDKIIAIHYNVTEMNFSVTITAKSVG